MNLPTVDQETRAVHILGTSIDAMVQNGRSYFSTIPASDRLTAEADKDASYEAVLGNKSSIEDSDGWRRASLRESVWLAIKWLMEGKHLPAQIVTATEHHTYALATTQPHQPLMAIVQVCDGRITLAKNYAGALGSSPQSFWLRPASN